VTVPETIGWWEQGEKAFRNTVEELSPEQYDDPSLLPGWERRRVIGHVSRNADALVNLLNWARTGVETPMYPSAEAREQGILQTSKLPAEELLADYRASSARLAEAIKSQPEEAWDNKVRTAQGREVPSSEVPWMRCREVWIHAVDLDASFGFADIPSEVLVAIVDDVFRMWGRRDVTPSLTVVAEGRSWGEGPPRVEGDIAEVASWLTGRAKSERIASQLGGLEVPPWL
jgi:maleylpyruvate isomerase